MAKQSAIEQDGVIVEALSNAMFRVELEYKLTLLYWQTDIVENHLIRERLGDVLKLDDVIWFHHVSNNVLVVNKPHAIKAS